MLRVRSERGWDESFLRRVYPHIYALGTDVRTFGMRSEGKPLGGANLEGWGDSVGTIRQDLKQRSWGRGVD